MDFHSAFNLGKAHKLLNILHFLIFFSLDHSVKIVWVIQYLIIIHVLISALKEHIELIKIIVYIVELEKFGMEQIVLLNAHKANT